MSISPTPTPDPGITSVSLRYIGSISQAHGIEFCLRIEISVANGLVQNHASRFARYRAMERSNGNLESTHRTLEINNMVRFIPERVQQGENSMSFEH
jgi:hypothetical protein